MRKADPPSGLRFDCGSETCAASRPYQPAIRSSSQSSMRARTPAIAILAALAASPAAGQAPLSDAQERALEAQDRFRECAGCPELVVVALGRFLMGSPKSEKPREANEGPQHAVTIAHRFALGRFEVTVDQLAAFVDETRHDMGTSCDVWGSATCSNGSRTAGTTATTARLLMARPGSSATATRAYSAAAPGAIRPIISAPRCAAGRRRIIAM